MILDNDRDDYELDLQCLYQYPADTPGGSPTGDGFFHKLSEKQTETLMKLQRHVIDQSIDMSLLARYSLHPSLTLLRYLRANQFDLEKTISHISANVAFRKKHNIDEVLVTDPEDILGCKMSKIQEVYPHWHCGYDKTGRPVLYKQYAKFDVDLMTTFTTIEAVTRYHLWEQETCMRLCTEMSHKRKEIIETTTSIMDLQDMKMNLVTSSFLSLVKEIAGIDKEQYPETLGKLYIINTPSAFPWVWGMVKRFLDPAVAAKIQVFGSQKTWLPVFTDLIGLENMPSNYGGLLPPLTPSMHPYASVMTSLAIDSHIIEQKSGGGAIDANDNTDKNQIGISGSSESTTTRVLPSEQGLESNVDDKNKAVINDTKTASKSGSSTQGMDTEIDSQSTSSSHHAHTPTAHHRSAGRTKDERSINSRRRRTRRRMNSRGSNASDSTDTTEGHDYDEDGERYDDDDMDDDESNMSHSSLGVSSDDEDSADGRTAAKSAHARSRERPLSGYFQGWDRELQFLHRFEEGIVQDTVVPKEDHSIYKRLASSSLSMFLRPVVACVRCLRFDFFLAKNTVASTIGKYIYVSVLFNVAIALICIIVAAVFISSADWSSNIAKVQLWTGVVVLLLSSLIIVINFIGGMGVYTLNRHLLYMYAFCMLIGSFIFILVAIACFLYSFVPAVAGYVALATTNSEASSLAKYDIGLAICSLLASLLCIIPMGLTFGMISRMRKEGGRRSAQKANRTKQLKVVVKYAQCISFCTSLVMLTYGGITVKYLSDINFSNTLPGVYGLIYGGMSVLITSFYGYWASETRRPLVLKSFYLIVLPLLFLLLIAAASVSLGTINYVETNVNNSLGTLLLGSTGAVTAEDVKIRVETQLLVCGVLCVFVSLFQCVSLIAARQLHVSHQIHALTSKGIDAYGASGKSNFFLSLDDVEDGLLQREVLLQSFNRENRPQRGGASSWSVEVWNTLVICWALLMGLFYIYGLGTVVLLSSFMRREAPDLLRAKISEDSWQQWSILWVAPFLISAESVAAVLLGPLLLFFAWTKVVYAPYRHLIGIIASTSMVYSHFLFYGLYSNKDLDPVPSAAVMFVSTVLEVILPFSVLVTESMLSVLATSHADSYFLAYEGKVKTVADVWSRRSFVGGSKPWDLDDDKGSTVSSHSFSYSISSLIGAPTSLSGKAEGDTSQSITSQAAKLWRRWKPHKTVELVKRFTSKTNRRLRRGGGAGGNHGKDGLGGSGSNNNPFDDQKSTVGAMLLMTQAKEAVLTHSVPFDSTLYAAIADQGQSAHRTSMNLPLSSSNPSAVLQSLALRRQTTPSSSLAMVV